MEGQMGHVRKCGGVVCAVRISWERETTAQISAGTETATRSRQSQGKRPLLLGTDGLQRRKFLWPLWTRKKVEIQLPGKKEHWGKFKAIKEGGRDGVGWICNIRGFCKVGSCCARDQEVLPRGNSVVGWDSASEMNRQLFLSRIDVQ